MSRTSILAVNSSFALILAAGCNLKVGDLGELTQSGADTANDSSGPNDSNSSVGSADTGPSTGADATTGQSDTDEPTTGDPPASGQGVDILFIIDNSGSMGAHQQRLTDAIPALVDPLIAAGRSLHIAVTTTDAGNPRCASTTPENGAFQAQSCRVGVDTGEWNFADSDFSDICLDLCTKETLEFSPTTTAMDPSLKVRPWVEWDGVTGNVEASLHQALGCMLPQGVAGCGFESPLEAMRLAIKRAQTPNDPQFGFLRTDADLLVVIVTDEIDCSHNPEFDELFIDNNVFWNSPEDPGPTSGMCWRAGVTCSGGPDTFDDCVATDHDPSGMITADPAQAVLFPVDRYRDALSEVTGHQVGGAKVRLAAITGVPIGYPQTQLPFEMSDDAIFNENFGIGPGCVADDGAAAVPPLRILELIEDNSPDSIGTFSICEDNFQSTLAAISAAVMGG